MKGLKEGNGLQDIEVYGLVVFSMGWRCCAIGVRPTVVLVGNERLFIALIGADNANDIIGYGCLFD